MTDNGKPNLYPSLTQTADTTRQERASLETDATTYTQKDQWTSH